LFAAEIGDSVDHGRQESPIRQSGNGLRRFVRPQTRKLLAGVLKLYRILAVSIIPIDEIIG
jgi:hypothetical protein